MSSSSNFSNKTKDYWDKQFPDNDLEKARKLNNLHKEKVNITKKEESLKKRRRRFRFTRTNSQNSSRRHTTSSINYYN